MADLDALVASPWWRWMPGMTASGRNRNGSKRSGVVTEVINGHPNVVTAAGDDVLLVDAAPDVSAPSTTGCLLALMYAAEAQHITPSPVSVCLSQFGLTDPRTVDAIISAILAAPPPGVDRG